jgi:eukaryotic-like serine/threonine-protein kinase
LATISTSGDGAASASERIGQDSVTRSELAADSVFGDYRIRRLLGRGGMGTVYEAEQIADGRVVALKILNIDLGQMGARDRFLREGRSAAAINHPNTVYVYRAEEIDGVATICMELVADGTLQQRVQSRGPLPVGETMEYAMHLINGLAAAHDVGLLHRDVKPSNCFVDNNGTLKIGDFGLSKPSNADEQLRLTQSGVFLGTPAYSSPEQLLGGPLDVRSDIYAVGLTLYYALTATLPFPSGSMMQVIASVVNGEPVPISKRRPDLPAPVAAIVMKALARKPADRFQNYDEFRDALAALREADSSAALPKDRIRAWLVDATIVELLANGLWALLPPVGHPLVVQNTYLGTVAFVIPMLLVAIPEGLRGATPGKWLLGIRLVGPDGDAPGLARAFGRVAVLWSSFSLAYDVTERLSGSEGAALLAFLVARALVLLPARRANGWRTVYDLLMGTYVARSAPAPLRRRRPNYTAPKPPIVESAERVGPYVVTGAGEAPRGCVSGWDPTLSRPVWIAAGQMGHRVGEARRSVTRTTRLRWLGSGGANDASWNSYSAPGGEPLLRRVERPMKWSDVQSWTEELTDELLAAEQDGTLPVIPGIDALWIGANGGLVLIDTAPRSVADAPPRRARDLVTEFVAFVRSSVQFPPGMPAFVTAALDAAGTAADPEAARAAIIATEGRAIEVTRRRRTWMLIAQPVSIFLVPFIAGQLFWDWQRSYYVRDPDAVKLAVLVRYRDSATCVCPTDAARDSLQRTRRLASIYIASVLGKRARDTMVSPLLSRSQQARAAAIAQQYESASAAEVSDARFFVDSLWRRIDPVSFLSGLAFSIAVSIALLAVSASVVAAALFRRGLMTRLFDVDFVTADGRPADRWRIGFRQLVVAVPVGVVLFPFVFRPIPLIGSSPVADSVAVGLGVVWLWYLWHAARFPAQSVADKIAKTCLVPA